MLVYLSSPAVRGVVGRSGRLIRSWLCSCCAVRRVCRLTTLGARACVVGDGSVVLSTRVVYQALLALTQLQRDQYREAVCARAARSIYRVCDAPACVVSNHARQHGAVAVL
jgi:hypothetical protein